MRFLVGSVSNNTTTTITTSSNSNNNNTIIHNSTSNSNMNGSFGLLGHGRLLGKSFRWLRWSTLCAILFYMFFIGLILHSSHSGNGNGHGKSTGTISPAHNPNRNHNGNHNNNEINAHTRAAAAAAVAAAVSSSSSAAVDEQQRDANGASSKSHVLQAPPSASSSTAMQQQQQQRNGVNGVSSSSSTSTTNGVNGNGLIAKGGTAGGGNNKPNEPETVILAASSVNEKQILEKVFRRADKNQDGRLSIQELALHINHKINEHIDDAIQRNPREFRRVDIAPADGLISWEEYHNYFLREHGLNDADLDEHGEIRATTLNRKIREELLRDKARWTEVARTDVFSLTIDEFLAFRHPESSVTNLLELVDDLLRQFDQDGDDQLSLEEFSDVSVNDDEDLIRKSLISRTVVERRAEFKRILDRNHDGHADREELLHYVDPKTPRYALQESATLFALADENHDDALTLDELVANAEIFLTSKMIDTANSFHTEF